MRQYTIIKTENRNQLNWFLVNEQFATVRYNNTGDAFLVSFDAANAESVLNISEGNWMSLVKAQELMQTPEWIKITEDI